MLLSLPLLIMLGLPAQAQTTAEPAAVIAPMVGEEVAALVHVDLSKINFTDTVKRLAGPFANDQEFARGITSASTVIDSLKKAGAQDLFILVDPTEFPNLPMFVFTLKPGSDPKPLQALLSGMLPQNGPSATAVEVIDKLVVGGPPEVVAFARTGSYPPRADLKAAFAAADNSAAKILIIPSAVQRKALEESFTTLPKELGGGPITTFTQGLTWGSLFLTSGAEPGLKLLLQSKDAATAGQLATLANHFKTLAAEQAKQNPLAAPLAGVFEKITPQEKGDQVVMELSPRLLGDLVIPPVQAAREAARRSACVNNLKQIGLAMHNHAASFGDRFPPAYIASKDGKPLLSWRVKILPYLDQQELYNQFKLDEPWDSEHNKALIAKMPALYACPSGKLESAQGKTCYLAPRGAHTIITGTQGVKIQEITDGTSNTVMVAEVGDDASVIWTKPDDWEIGETVDFKPLLGHHAIGSNFLFGDGSVRFIAETIKPAVLKALLTRDGGEVINANEF